MVNLIPSGSVCCSQPLAEPNYTVCFPPMQVIPGGTINFNPFYDFDEKKSYWIYIIQIDSGPSSQITDLSHWVLQICPDLAAREEKNDFKVEISSGGIFSHISRFEVLRRDPPTGVKNVLKIDRQQNKGTTLVYRITIDNPDFFNLEAEAGTIGIKTGRISGTVIFNPDTCAENVLPTPSVDCKKTGHQPVAPELNIRKTDSPDPVVVGNRLTYTITVTNNGTAPATGVIFQDNLPATVDFVSVNSSQGNCSVTGDIVTCNLGTIQPVHSTVIEIVVIPEAAGKTSNTAIVRSNQTDPVSTTEDTEVKAPPPPEVSLTLIKQDSPDPVTVGDILAYMIIVINNGPDTATNVVVNDVLPDSVNFILADTSQGSCSRLGSTVTCNIGTLQPGAAAMIEIMVVPTRAGQISNIAEVISDQTDPTNVRENTTVKRQPANISITKFAAPDPAVVGKRINYHITVTNTGERILRNIQVTDMLPQGVQFISVNTTQGSCSQSGGVVTCNIGNLAQDESATISIAVRPITSGNLTNTAVVNSNQTDPQTVSIETEVTPLPDLVQIVITRGKIKQVIPTGLFKDKLLSLINQVETLLDRGNIRGAMKIVSRMIFLVDKMIKKGSHISE